MKNASKHWTQNEWRTSLEVFIGTVPHLFKCKKGNYLCIKHMFKSTLKKVLEIATYKQEFKATLKMLLTWQNKIQIVQADLHTSIVVGDSRENSISNTNK